MTNDEFLDILKETAKEYVYFSDDEIKKILNLANHAIHTNLLVVADKIDKREIYKSLLPMINKAEGELKELLHRIAPAWYNTLLERWFHRGMREDTRIIPLWEIIFSELHLSTGDVLSGMSDHGTGEYMIGDPIRREVIERNLKRTKLPNIDKIGESSLISTLEYYFSRCASMIVNFLYMKDSKYYEEKVSILKEFVNFIRIGYGFLFLITNLYSPRIEIRLPVWQEEDYPEVIDCEEAPWFDVAVIKEGVFVPEKVWRKPEKLTAQDIIFEPNLEVRRMMLNIIDIKRFLRESNAKLINVDKKRDLQLFRITSYKTVIHMLRCVCPTTHREYLLTIPPNIRKAHEAVAWTFGETSKTYLPVVET